MVSGHQRELADVLGRLNEDLAKMYLGSLLVLADRDNPDRLPQAAHSLRELMEKLPIFMGVSMRAHSEGMTSEIREVEDLWAVTARKSRCFVDGEWQGPVDSPLHRLLVRVDRFFRWLENHMPRRRQEWAMALRSLDATGRDLPPAMVNKNIKMLMGLRDYFVGVAHHRFSTTEETFREHQDRLEIFLLERLIPKPLEDYAEIDSLLGVE